MLNESESKATAMLETETPREPVETRITKKIEVTFDTGLPMGTCARFKYDGDIWIAYPSKKNTRILAVMDRLLGIYNGLTENTVRILNRHPDNPGVQELAVATLDSVDRARQRWFELGSEKVRAVTS